MTLIEHLTLVEETRSDINRKHDLVDVMFLVISAIMSGAEGWRDIETYANIVLLPMASHAVTPLLEFCVVLSSTPCLKHCCAG